jgi:hypothetical protein
MGWRPTAIGIPEPETCRLGGHLAEVDEKAPEPISPECNNIT